MEQASTLYGGSVTLLLDSRHSYWACVDGEERVKAIGVTSVSGLLDKPGLKFWAVNLACDLILEAIRNGQEVTEALVEEARTRHSKRTKEAATSGTKVHEWAEAWIKSQIAGGEAPAVPEDEQVMNGALAFMRWTKEHSVRFVSSERLVYSVALNYAGTMDAEAIVDGKLRVVDFKTSSAKKPAKGKENMPCDACGKVGCGGVREEHRFQTAGYQLAAEEEGSKYEGKRLVVRFDKETADFDVHELGDYNQDRDAFLGLLAAKMRLNELS